MAVFTKERVAKLLHDLNFKADAGETAAFARQLEFIEAEIYKVEYPANRAREFIPVDSAIPDWALTFTWRIWDWAGMAAIVTRFSDDLPAVDIMAAEITQRIQTLGDSFGYSIEDLTYSAKMGTNLETEKGELARMAHENKVESLATFGDVKAALPGFLNNPNVPILSAPGTLNGDWLNPATTPKQILADMHTMAKTVVSQTKNTHAADTLLLPLDHYSHVAETTLNDYNSETILTTFLKQSTWIRNVDQWTYLDTADAARTGPRAVCYKRDPKVVRLVLPREFTMQPPQPKNLAFNIPCHSRIGGVSWRYPLAAVYGDLA
jgi:hypothetical protein